MNVLWIVNNVLPEAQELLTGDSNYKFSGGWIIGAAEALTKQQELSLTVATCAVGINNLIRLAGKSIVYYLLPYGKGNITINHEYEHYWRQIRDEVKPDIVHIHGTEFSHGYAYVEACGAKNVCVSIQGLVDVISRYYTYGLSRMEMVKTMTLASIIKGGVYSKKREYKKRGESEVSLIPKVNYLIGRTTWDRAHAWALNPNAIYYHCDETLRSVFYDSEKWVYSGCKPHSIFLSQSYIPIKGLHQVLKAMPLILRHYPDAIVRIAGQDITRSNGCFLEKLKISDYGNYIKRLIKQFGLKDKIFFTGRLNAVEMTKEYLRANVFVCPSSIENSPNSLGEAQVLGVPVVASYVGGIPNMMRGNEDYLYRFDDIEMLAERIVSVFNQEDNINTIKTRDAALQRHDPKNNVERLLKIYIDILTLEKKHCE